MQKPDPAKWHVDMLLRAEALMDHEFEYLFKCEICRDVIRNNDVPCVAAQCCYCWIPGDDVLYWRRWWQFVFGEVRFYDEYRITHKSPSFRAIYQLRRVVKMAKAPAHNASERLLAEFEQQQKRRFAIILGELPNVYWGAEKREEFIKWRQEIKPFVEAELVVQKPLEPVKKEPRVKKRKLDSEGQMRLF